MARKATKKTATRYLSRKTTRKTSRKTTRSTARKTPKKASRKRARKGTKRQPLRRRNPPGKKGFELSVTFLVILIIAIVIFTSGIYLIKQFFSVTLKIEERVTAQTQKEIERRLIEAGEKVAVPFNRKQVKIGDSRTFGLGILNTLGQSNLFGVEMSFNKAFTLKEQQEIFPELAYMNQDWIYSELPNQQLKRNEHIIIPLTVRVGSKTAEGVITKKDVVYIFNACVYKDISDKGLKICEKAKPTAFDLEKLHGNQIKKIYVEVI